MLSIVEKKEEQLLSRTLVKASMDFEKSTPSYQEAASLLAASLKADEKLVAIRHIYTHFGDKKANVIAYLYADESKKQAIEPKKKEKRGKKAAKAEKK
ncbi:hypothetical protein HY637_02630 [Candidatus Woesearchaeota archaeon]|nr:hypothetical protein [Candidatus Woesearchaeota archaeon]